MHPFTSNGCLSCFQDLTTVNNGTCIPKHMYKTDLTVKLLSNRICICSTLVVNAKWFLQIVDQFIFISAKCENFVFILAIVISTQWELIVSSIYISQITNEVENLFFFLFTDHLDVFFLSWISCSILCPFFFYSHLTFILVSRNFNIFWIWVLGYNYILYVINIQV